MKRTSPLTPFAPSPGDDLTPLLAMLRAAPSQGLTLHVGDQDVALPASATAALLSVAEHLHAGRLVHVLNGSRQLTSGQASALLGISRPTLYRLLDAEEIPYTRTGAHRRILLSDVLAWQDRHISEEP